jgi:hypothetical protein
MKLLKIVYQGINSEKMYSINPKKVSLISRYVDLTDLRTGAKNPYIVCVTMDNGRDIYFRFFSKDVQIDAYNRLILAIRKKRSTIDINCK